MPRPPNSNCPISVIRTAFGLSAGEFAELIGCGKSTIQHIETGARPLHPDLADRIHLMTGLPRDWLDQDTLKLQVVRDWLDSSARIPGHRSSFSPRSDLERETSGGPFSTWNAIFPAESILPKMAAAFYACGLESINPFLIVLAVDRALNEAISRFGLDRDTLKKLCEDTARYYFGTPRKKSRQARTERSSPGARSLRDFCRLHAEEMREAEKIWAVHGFELDENGVRKKMVGKGSET